MTVEKVVAWMPMTDAMIEDQALGAWAIYALTHPMHGPPAPRDPMECRCGYGLDCLRHSTLTEDELAAVAALHEADIEVGEAGGGFFAGQAEEVMLVLRQAGFRVTR